MEEVFYDFGRAGVQADQVDHAIVFWTGQIGAGAGQQARDHSAIMNHES